MKKDTFTATYAGECYVQTTYGRELYKKAVRLKDVLNENNELVFSKTEIKLSKFFKDNNEIISGDKIKFNAIISKDNRLIYVSDIKIQK